MLVMSDDSETLPFRFVGEAHRLLVAQTTTTPPAKLVVKNALILTMAANQREPVKGYLVVGEDGRLITVAAGDPPSGLAGKGNASTPAATWIIPGFLSAHSHLWQSAFRGLGADQTLMGWIECTLYSRPSKASPEDYVLVHAGWMPRPSAAWHYRRV